MNDSILFAPPLAILPRVAFKQIVRTAGRDRGGDNPPPPEYMAGMIQQFDVESPVHGKESWLSFHVPI